jgi:flavoprotein
MTPSEILKRECEEITQRIGIYIPPYRLSNLMKIAQKITDILLTNAVCMSYHESILVLRIVMNAIKTCTGEEVES